VAFRRRLQAVPADNDGAEPLVRVEAQDEVREANDSARALAVAAANGFRQCVVRAMGEGIAVDHEQRATRECELTNSRWMPFPSCPIAGPMGRSLRFRRRHRPCRNRLATSLSKQIAAAVWPIPKSYPHGRVVASVRHSTRLAIDAGALQALRQRGTQQNVIKTQAANLVSAANASSPESKITTRVSSPAILALFMEVRPRFVGRERPL
jgi:hypothetical protein